MKVFDFTNGEKGKFLAEVKITDFSDGWFVRKENKVYRVELTNPKNKISTGEEEKSGINWAWASGAGWADTEKLIRPEDFGVEAICFCTGNTYHMWHEGHSEARATWEWNVIGTKNWNRKSCEKGILKSTFSHEAHGFERIA